MFLEVNYANTMKNNRSKSHLHVLRVRNFSWPEIKLTDFLLIRMLYDQHFCFPSRSHLGNMAFPCSVCGGGKGERECSICIAIFKYISETTKCPYKIYTVEKDCLIIPSKVSLKCLIKCELFDENSCSKENFSVMNLL